MAHGTMARLRLGDAHLPVATGKLLERAAKGAEIDPAELNPVFAGAEALDTELVFGTPKRFPRIGQLIG